MYVSMLFLPSSKFSTVRPPYLYRPHIRSSLSSFEIFMGKDNDCSELDFAFLTATVMFSVSAAVAVSDPLPVSLALFLSVPLAFLVALIVSLAFLGLRAPLVSS